MNFWQRRKVLKGVNYLELTPLRLYEFEVKEDKLVTILVPRFDNKFLQKNIGASRKSPYVNFKLDTLGSKTWLFTDGETKVGLICEKLQQDSEEQIPECEQRVTKFLTELYLNKFISFKEIQ